MRRADRLVQILLLLRGRRHTTASQLAQWLEVSSRTIYRDMLDLMKSGAPINGEAGTGYWLESGFTPPAVAFSERELAALEVGARMLAAWADHGTASAAHSALARIHAVLGSSGMALEPVFVPPAGNYPRERLGPLREAIMQQQALQVVYTDEAGNLSQRLLYPLGLFFWGNRWVLAAWCDLRQDYRSFRVDRLQSWEVVQQAFPEGVNLPDYLQCAEGGESAQLWLAQHHKRAWYD